MAKKQAKRSSHGDKYADKAKQHKADLARDQERWAKERVDIPEPSKQRPKRPTNSAASSS